MNNILSIYLLDSFYQGSDNTIRWDCTKFSNSIQGRNARKQSQKRLKLMSLWRQDLRYADYFNKLLHEFIVNLYFVGASSARFEWH